MSSLRDGGGRSRWGFAFRRFAICSLAVLAFAETLSVFAQQSDRARPKEFSAFQLINDRNIFDPNRRPRVQQKNPAPRQQQIVDSFSLVGTMSYSNVLLAFFDGTGSDYRKSVDTGGKIAGFTATEISYNAVKLTSGTNEIKLKVGMQMRRSEDGHWSATEQSGGNSYSSNESRGGRSSDRNDRRSRGNRSQSSVADQASTPETGNPTGAPMASPDVSNLDTNDPVARLMLRRLQEEGGSQPNNNPPPEPPPGDNSGAGAGGPPPGNDNNPNPNPNGQPEQQ